MEKTGQIEIKIQGKVGDQDLNPSNFDIRQIIKLLENVENLLYPTAQKDRPTIAYEQKEGSVMNLFHTNIQKVIGFDALINEVGMQESIDFLEEKSAKAFESLQEVAYQKEYTFLFKTSLSEDYKLAISPTTAYKRAEDHWLETELYFYGIIRDAGGKSSINIHLDTQDYGYLSITTDEHFLKDQQENLLYKKMGARVIGKQSLESGEIDTSSLKLIELVDYNPTYDEDYFNEIIKKASKNWENFDSDSWLDELRGR